MGFSKGMNCGALDLLGEIVAGVPPGRAVGDRPGGVRSLVPGVVGVAEVPGEGARMSLRVVLAPRACGCPALGRGNGSLVEVSDQAGVPRRWSWVTGPGESSGSR